MPLNFDALAGVLLELLCGGQSATDGVGTGFDRNLASDADFNSFTPRGLPIPHTQYAPATTSITSTRNGRRFQYGFARFDVA
jgi:hypothetical protein